MNNALSRGIFAFGLAAITTFGAAMAGAQNAQPLTLLGTTPIPAVTGGDFDHFAVNLHANRLYVSAEVHHSIEIFNLKTGAHIASAGTVVKTPHTLAYIADKNELFVADGGDRAVNVLDGTDLHLIARIPLAGDPDAGVYDATTRLFYVGNGGKPDHEAFSYLSAISVDTMRDVSNVRIESTNLESMSIDDASSTMYLNMRDKNRVGVIDLKGHAFVRSFSVAGMHLNTPLVYDAAHRVLMIAGRKPGKLLIVNAVDGSVLQTLPSVETADDMTFDAVAGRIYISGAGGLNVYHATSTSHFAQIAHYDTLGGKTSVYVPSLHRFFVVHTKSELAHEAGLQIYRVNQ